MFENPRRGRQGRNFTTNVPKILDLKWSSEQIFFRKLSLGAPGTLLAIANLWWPTTVTAKTKTSRQWQNTSRQNQILHGENKIALVLQWVFAFAVRYLVFAVKYLVLPWGLWFCREVFGFVVRYFVFAVRFLFLPWGFRFCRKVFCFCREVFGFAVRFLVLPWQLGATVMRSSPGCELDSTPPPPATIPQCSWFLNLGGIHVFFAMLKAKDKKNFYWLFICFLLGKTEFCMYNDLIQRTNDSIWIIHEALVTKFRVYMLKTFWTHRWRMQSLHPYARGTILYPFLSFPIPFLILLSAHNSFNVITPPWHPCTV